MSSDLAICLFGISYDKHYEHWGEGFRSVDYRRSLQNYHDHIFSLCGKYDLYYSTYNHELIDQMKADYKATDGISIAQPPKTGIALESALQRNSMIANLEHLLENGSHNWYIFTRFDLHLHFNLEDLNIRADKINILTTLEQPRFICDNFYIVSRERIVQFFGYMKQQDITDYNRHDINFFGGSHNINIMRYEPGNLLVPQLSAYTIVRGEPIRAITPPHEDNSTPIRNDDHRRPITPKRNDYRRPITSLYDDDFSSITPLRDDEYGPMTPIRDDNYPSSISNNNITPIRDDNYPPSISNNNDTIISNNNITPISNNINNNQRLHFNIAISIMVITNACLDNLISNITTYVPDVVIILHIDPKLDTWISPKYNNVIVNPNRYPCKYNDTQIGHIVSNFLCLTKANITFNYFMIVSEDALFIKHGINAYISNFDAGYLHTRRYPRQYNIEYNPQTQKIRNLFPRLKQIRYISDINGQYYRTELFQQIIQVVADVYDPNMPTNPHEEEFIFPMLIDSFASKISPSICHPNLWASSITIDELNLSLNNEVIFLVKRVPQDISDPIRILINNL